MPAIVINNGESNNPRSQLSGAEVIRAFARNLKNEPGVYRMLNASGDVLYVGKARHLRKRVQSYTNINRHTVRIARMIHQTATMEFTTTRTEAEALLLEATLIKRLRPPYNISLRDDKSFPFIHFSAHHVPRLRRYRGSRAVGGDFFGPFVSSTAVSHTVLALQRGFGLRTCTDNVFANRSRPCLLFQIKRCAAPCTGEISAEQYQARVAMARRFLSGQGKSIGQEVESEMNDAALRHDYEAAAVYRDRLLALNSVLAEQGLHAPNLHEADLFALYRNGANTCIQVFFFRGGMNLGDRAYFPKHVPADSSAEVMSYFLGQFYASRPPPREVLTSINAGGATLLKQALQLRRGSAINLRKPQRGAKAQLMNLALRNAQRSLEAHLHSRASLESQLGALAQMVGLSKLPERIEAYDNSHLRGDRALGVMIVAGLDGFEKSAYRKFNIKTADTQDDYAMMEEVLARRFGADAARRSGFAVKPDLLVIDGGAGQLNRALQVLSDLGKGDVPVIAIAKGSNRREDVETLHRAGHSPMVLRAGHAALPLVQTIRDEAHRFAIGALRAGRRRAMTASAMDEIAGVGAKRRRLVLQHFGSVRKVASASIEELAAVDGISHAIAQSIWYHFNT